MWLTPEEIQDLQEELDDLNQIIPELRERLRKEIQKLDSYTVNTGQTTQSVKHKSILHLEALLEKKRKRREEIRNELKGSGTSLVRSA